MVSAASLWPPRIAALVLSTAAAASVAYWGLHWQLSTTPNLAATPAGGDQPVDSAAVAKALGAAGSAAQELVSQAPRPSDASRFVLQGVLGNASAGSALIAVDGKPPKPVRVGDSLADDWTLRQVQGRRAVLSRQGVDLELTLPPLPVPATLAKKTP
jgi:general secretion pathway protein C